MEKPERKFILKAALYIAVTGLGAAVMPAAIRAAEAHRGQAGQIGGEYLIIPLLWLLVALVKTVLSILAEYLVDRIK